MSKEREEVGVTLREDDPYESGYMTPDGEEVLFRDKFIARWPWHAIMGAATLITVGSLGLPALVGGPLTPWWVWLLSVLPMLAIWILFAVIRVTVTTRNVHVQMGPLGPKIAIEDIVSAESVDYDWKTYGGWGIRYKPGQGVAYNMMGDGGEAVKLVRRTKAGKERDVLVSSSQAPLIVDAIQRALAMAARGSEVTAREDVALDFGEDEELASEVEEAREEVSG